MNLITMAHLGEAQGVIDLLGLERSAENLYESKDYILLITGEGPFEAATAVSATIARYKFSHAYNLGIAGSLNEKLTIGSVHPIRSIYLVIEGKPQFKTFQCQEAGLDCITTFERILNPDKAQALKGLGDLVDRESWGVGFACKQHSIPFTAFKIVSDQAGSLEACELVKTKAMHFAELISNEAKRIFKSNDDLVLEGFHFTFSTKIQFQQKLQMLSLRDDKTDHQIIGELGIEELRDLKILPKERTKLLLNKMDQKLDPLKEKIDGYLKDWKGPWLNRGITIQNDPSFENAEVTISFKASSDEELGDKIVELSKLTLNPYLKLREGHVE